MRDASNLNEFSESLLPVAWLNAGAVVSKGKRLANVRGELYVGEKLVGTADGNFAIMQPAKSVRAQSSVRPVLLPNSRVERDDTNAIATAARDLSPSSRASSTRHVTPENWCVDVSLLVEQSRKVKFHADKVGL